MAKVPINAGRSPESKREGPEPACCASTPCNLQGGRSPHVLASERQRQALGVSSQPSAPAQPLQEPQGFSLGLELLFFCVCIYVLSLQETRGFLVSFPKSVSPPSFLISINSAFITQGLIFQVPAEAAPPPWKDPPRHQI